MAKLAINGGKLSAEVKCWLQFQQPARSSFRFLDPPELRKRRRPYLTASILN